MNLLKKLGVLLLTTAMVVGSVFIGDTQNSYAATSYKKRIYPNTVYKYDLDGDGDKDSIKVYVSSKTGNLLVKVNSCVKTLIYDYDKDCHSYDVKLYDFNKNDKSLEIVLTWYGFSEWGTRILKFRNSTCKLNESYYDALLYNYTSSNGMVTFVECERGRYYKFANAIGCFSCLDKVRINGYSAYKQYTANTTGNISGNQNIEAIAANMRSNKYIAAKTLTAYTSTSGTKKAFTISKGSPAYIYALYQNGSKRYIKVKNKYGKYGYVKIGTSLLFKEDSCIWWR